MNTVNKKSKSTPLIKRTSGELASHVKKGKPKYSTEFAERINRKTHFTTEECKSLLHMHHKIESTMGKIDRLRFREIFYSTFDITDDIMLDRVFRVFDQNDNGFIDETEWVQGLSKIIRGTPDELIDFCYFVYDFNNDRYITREELFYCLRGCILMWEGVISNEEVDEGVREIVDIAMKKLDLDQDGHIRFHEFKEATKDNPLLLQAIGPCLPNPSSLAAFLSTFTEDYRSYTPCFGGIWNSPNPNSYQHHERILSKSSKTFIKGKNVIVASSRFSHSAENHNDSKSLFDANTDKTV